VRLADEEGRNQPSDGGGGRRGERRRAKVDRSGRVVERAVRQTAHRSPPKIAEDVVTAALQGVGRQLLMKDRFQQPDTPQSRQN